MIEISDVTKARPEKDAKTSPEKNSMDSAIEPNK